MGERPAPHAQCRAAQNKRARWGATGDAGSGKRKPGQMEGGRAEKPAGGGGWRLPVCSWQGSPRNLKLPQHHRRLTTAWGS